jgi:hypothetical protein
MTITEHLESYDDDPNEAYEVIPMPENLRGPSGWWTVTCNGIPVRHSPDRSIMERYATDPEYRKSLVTKKLWEAGLKS